MAQRVVLHVGLMKSGTTFLQGRLDDNRERLAEQGVLFPGPTRRRHVTAVSDFIGVRGRLAGSWESLREQINDHPGTAVVSMEHLAMLGPRKIRRLAAGFDTLDLRIVVGVCDLGRLVPAMWQEVVRNRQVWTFAEYLESIRTDGPGGRRFWRQQHAGRIVTRWAGTLTPGRVYVVTVPRAEAADETLWDRFSQVAGVEPTRWRQAPAADEALGAASTLVVRELNLRTRDLSPTDYRRRVTALARHLMPPHRHSEPPVGFVVPAWLRERADEMRAQIERSAVHVVGDLDELLPLDVPGADPETVEPSVRLEAALAALEATLRQMPRVRPR